MEFIQTAGVAEGAQRSCLPAAPTLHPHRGMALPRLPGLLHGCEPGDAGKPTGMERWPGEMSLFQCHTSHHPFPAHAASRALRLHHQSSLVPACTTEQPLTPSLPANSLILPKNRDTERQQQPRPGQARLGPAPEGACGYPAPKPEGCSILGEGGGDLEACPFKCCWRLFLGHWLKIKTRIPVFFYQKVHDPF